MSDDTTLTLGPPEDQPMAPKRPITMREAGHKGGTTTRDRHGSQHYSEAAKKGAKMRYGDRLKPPVTEGRKKKGNPSSGKTRWSPPEGSGIE